MAALKTDVAALLNHLKSGATNGVDAAVQQIDESALEALVSFAI